MLRTVTPAMEGMRILDVEYAICADLGVDNPEKFLAPYGGRCGCRRSRARGREYLLLCEAYLIPEDRFPNNWSGGYDRPGSENLRRWRRTQGLDSLRE